MELRVHMDCHGCQRRIRKALSKLDGVDSVEIDMATQKVTVMGWANPDDVLKTVKKTGRSVELWPFPYNADFNDYYGSSGHNLYSNDGSRYYGRDSYVPVDTQSNYVDCDNDGYYQQPSYYPVTLEEKATTMFSDDNATGCSIM
ncbi:heavy metal-associated isoprenylated plant protein 45-like [Andrographis paniculata]|uniref:heavy metal-associated isoprenylated plant protein 45-like n=1 Tax=Andrographis paniculata TaxID=175694 RepID=UPI0021E8038B|nr:heavy metal-associated isoprenylated plant protein 45-like [Andrographis paniculata]